MRRMVSILLLGCAMSAADAARANCGGTFQRFLDELATEAVSLGHDAGDVARFLRNVRRDEAVIRADRRQGVFQLDFTRFARRLISADRLKRGQAKAIEHAQIFREIEARYGVPKGVLLAFWAFETDYGAFQGDFNTVNALVTLAHDCRRPELFRPQIFSALTLFSRGELDPERTTGAWAGEIGMVQMLPGDILAHGVDGDGDGRVDLKRSIADALTSGAALISALGWQAGAPWLQEVTVPESFDWGLSGLDTELSVADWQARGLAPRSGQFKAQGPASLILPQGAGGPAFLAYPNFRVYFEWNQSFTYVLTAAYFATRLEGAQVFDAGEPAPGLDGPGMIKLQQKLQARGYDVGQADGILGAKTRAAVKDIQSKLGLPADAWPTPELLHRL